MPAVEVMCGAVVRLWLRVAADALDRARPAIDVLNGAARAAACGTHQAAVATALTERLLTG